jgi:uncharacterized protein DUF4160
VNIASFSFLNLFFTLLMSADQMPTIFQVNGYRFFFYSNEGNPREPLHIHVRKGGAELKIWLAPNISIARNHGFDGKTQRFLLSVATERKSEIERAWHDYFG